MSKIEGYLTEDSRILIYDNNANSLVVDQVVNSGNYSFVGLTVFDKSVIAIRESDGKSLAYGNVTPVPSPDPISPIFSPASASSRDDGYGREPDRLYVDDIIMGYTGTNLYKAYVRFPGVTIPKDAVIDSAYVRFTIDDRYKGVVVLNVACENTDNSATLTNWDNFKNRPLTSSPASWSFSTMANSDGDVKNTPSIKTAVQSVVNRPGWVAGNALLVAFTYVSGTFVSIFGSEQVNYDWPQLRIVYRDF